MTSEKNRLVKVLEAANIKLSSVVTKIYGVSSLAMILFWEGQALKRWDLVFGTTFAESF